MSTEATQALIQAIFALTRGDLEGATLRAPRIQSVMSGHVWKRIIRLSRFWHPHADQAATGALDHALEDWLAGCHGAGWGTAFLVIGKLDAIEIWMGVSAQTSSDGLQASLRGALPDVRFAEGEKSMPSLSDRLVHAVAFTGTPMLKRLEEQDTPRTDQIERLCRGLYGNLWAYACFAQPYPRTSIATDLNRFTWEIHNTHAKYLLSSNAADENNRLAKRYVELLEAKIERWEKGRATGMWIFETIFLSENAELLGRAGAILVSAFSGEKSIPEPFRVHATSASGIVPVSPSPITSEELAALAALPNEEYPGYEIVPRIRFGVETNQAIGSDEDTVELGAISDRGQPIGRSLRIRRADLAKHGLIVGVTGSGKTNTCFCLLDQVWNEGKGTPFMVIESAKSEYRALLKNPRFRGLRVFTVADETISPLRLNPFEFPRGILVQSHIDYLQALFSAAFVLYPPMPYVLAMSIQKVYEDRGWDVVQNVNPRGENSTDCFPSLDDLIVKVREVTDAMGYEGEIRSNVKAGLEGRLNQLRIGGGKGLMLNCRTSISEEDLFGRPCILELKQLVSDEEKAFLIGLLLIRLNEHYESLGAPGDGKLKHLTLIEEAHRLLKNVSTEKGQDSANPQGKAIEVFANLLAEIRAYGEGIFMAEQVPVKLAPEALKNTNVKMIHRLVAKDDRDAVGATMNLDDEQLGALTTLRSGEAVTFLEGMEKPVLLRVPLAKSKAEITNVSSADIRSEMKTFWSQRGKLIRLYEACEVCECGPGKGGCGRNLGRISFDLEVAATHAFNAIRLSPRQVPAAFARLKMAYKNSILSMSAVGSSYCFAVDTFERELRSRAERGSLPHSQTREIANAFNAVAADNLLEKTPEVVSEIEAEKRLNTAQQLSRRLDPSRRPFAACVYCFNPCRFLSDATPLITKEMTKEFNILYRKDTLQLAGYLLGLAGEKLLPSERILSAGLAFCLAAENVANSKLALLDQRKIAGELRKKLKTKINE